MLPAPGQGALAIECRAEDRTLEAQLREHLDDTFTRAAVEAERAVLRTLEAGCPAPVGALAEIVEEADGPEVWVRAVALAPDGSVDIRRSASGPLAAAAEVGKRRTEKHTSELQALM